MKNVRFITRADDAGSSHSANGAIAKAIRRGFIQNVSVMAPGAYVEEAAALFGRGGKACFGMHATLNSEWDNMKWGPVSKLPPGNGLTDENGWFLPDPAMFPNSKPSLETIQKELAAQLDKLTRAGFRITYIDTHMFPESYLPGMNELVRNFSTEKGLLDHMYYYVLPAGLLSAARQGRLLPALRRVPSGQYFYVAHPALYSGEMLQTGNRSVSGEKVARARNEEAKLLGAPGVKLLMRTLGIRGIRYDQATPLARRLTPEDVKRILSEGDA
jgi:hypothetical protein